VVLKDGNVLTDSPLTPLADPEVAVTTLELDRLVSEPTVDFTSPALKNPPGRFGSAWALAKKDLKVELRTRDILGSAGLFSLAVLITASFTMPVGDTRSGAATGVLWIAILFATLLGVGRTMGRETADRGIEGLLLSPAPRESIFLGKLLGSFILLAIVEAFIIPLFLVMMTSDAQGASPLALMLVVLLGSLGLVTVSTLFSGIAVGSRLGESMLPLLVMPVVIPLMVGAVELSRQALSSGGGLGWQFLAILAGFDAMVLIASVVTFTYVIEE
jgi:heme exporter protein B